MDHVLIDSDVILDALFDRKPFAKFAVQILKLCESKKIKGYLTPLIYSNVYYLLRQSAQHEMVIQKLKQLLQITDVLQMDRNVVENALESDFKDFEDSLQHFSAVNHSQIDIILTRNIKDYKHSKLGVFTPEIYLKSFDTEQS